MKSFEEREAILEHFHKEIELLKPLAALALAVDGNDAMKKAAAAKLVSVFDPVFKMYGEGLNEAINPASDLSLLAIIITLRLTLQQIEEKNPNAARIAGTLMPAYSATVEQTKKYKPFEFRERTAGTF